MSRLGTTHLYWQITLPLKLNLNFQKSKKKIVCIYGAQLAPAFSLTTHEMKLMKFGDALYLVCDDNKNKPKL